MTEYTLHEPTDMHLLYPHVCFYLLYHPRNVVNVIFNTLYVTPQPQRWSQYMKLQIFYIFYIF